MAEEQQQQENQGQNQRNNSTRNTSRTSHTRSVAMSATISFSESRKYNFDVTGAASIEAKMVSVPAPEAFKAFIQRALNKSSE